MTEARKTVTVVFADVSGSTELGERLDPEALRRVMERHFAVVREALERHGGTVEKFIGDAVMAVFGIPAAHEDDALRALRAAAEIRELVGELNRELEPELGVALALRTGINTGEVVVGDPTGGQFYATGDAVNVAARLEQVADPGEILLGEGTYRLVHDAVRVDAVEPLHLKGKADSVSAYRLVELIEGAPALARRFDTPFVGRGKHMAHLLRSFERSVVERAPLLVTVLGAAGIGKTRLATEFAAKVAEDAQVLQGRCLSYGDGITFWPLQEILRSLPVRPPGAPAPEKVRSVEETFWAYRKLFESIARKRPLLLVVEDIHWAEQTLLDLIEHVVEWTYDVPMMFLCLARPELADSRPGWPGERIELEPLGSSDAHTLVRELGRGLDSRSLEQAITVAEGNPLFLEQMLAFVADEERGNVQVPQTIQALLTTRLDQLEPDERGLLEAAAVVGKEFWRRALLDLSSPGTEVSPLLQRLVRRRLIQPERSSLPDEDAFGFAHILIRDAVYNAITKTHRASLHEGFADWLEDVGSPYDEIVGYHLEQAYRFREELGLVDAHSHDLARRATQRLAVAARRALARDEQDAATLLFRSAALHPRGHPLRLSLLPELGQSLGDIGRYDEARSVLTEAVEEAHRAGDLGLEWRARLVQSTMDAQVGAQLIPTEKVVQTAKEALAIFEALDDPAGQAKAAAVLGRALSWLFRHAEAEEALNQARALARSVADVALEAECAGRLLHALVHGPKPVADAIQRAEEMLPAAAAHGLLLEQWVLSSLTVLLAQAGQIARAREVLARVKSVAEESGSEIHIATTAGFRAMTVELTAGNLEGAEAELRRAYEVLERLGEKGFRSTVAAWLGGVLVRQNRLDEAEVFLDIAAELSTPDDLATEVPLRLSRAQIQSARGKAREAESLIREALSLLEGTDDSNMLAEAHIAHARVLRAAGKSRQAMAEAEEAHRICTQKGNLALAESVGDLMNELAPLPS